MNKLSEKNQKLRDELKLFDDTIKPTETVEHMMIRLAALVGAFSDVVAEFSEKTEKQRKKS